MPLVVAIAMPLLLVGAWGVVLTCRRELGLVALSTRGALVVGFVVVQVVLWAITELASVGGHLTARWVLLAWVAVLVAGAVALRNRVPPPSQ